MLAALMTPEQELVGGGGGGGASRGEAKDSALLSSRDAGLLEPPALYLEQLTLRFPLG